MVIAFFGHADYQENEGDFARKIKKNQAFAVKKDGGFCVLWIKAE